ncbi:helix-turn-helix domain-containing protein [Tessaracoccus sp.]|uniref:helix-turn-helix domain-containing protein n=1 Tax=Tessaracoccus sp. TaxID=1971211 RepID=UPI002634D1EE|nr:helix-turn-helix transcriptional regulator [Tessaracoccus sp.]
MSVSPRRLALGSTVRALRKKKGLSQEGLAHAAGMDRTYVGGIERGERNVAFDNLCRLADALGVAPAVLLEDIPPATQRDR